MTRWSWQSRLVASLAIFSLGGLLLPVGAGAPVARLAGTVQGSTDAAPLVGVQVYAADPGSGRVYPSGPTDTSGRFRFDELPAAEYRLGVAADEGLYLVEAPVALRGGGERHVRVTLERNADADPPSNASGSPVATTSVWNNPFTAALIVLGSAVVVGVLVENATDDEDDVSPF